MHQPIMVAEVLRCLRPSPGDVALDCTLGSGAHARAVLERIAPAGRLIGIDADPLELPKTDARMRGEGFGPPGFIARLARFTDIRGVLDAEGVTGADVILADLGVSAMQHDDPARGFHYKRAGPLDMRMDPRSGETAADLIARLGESELSALLVRHADEPHADLIASLLKSCPIATTQALERVVRTGLTAVLAPPAKSAVKASVRRTFQALRIAVNDELRALDRLLEALPSCLAPGGRVAILTFHSGEDRRVKKAFQAGRRAGAYAEVSDRVVRSRVEETRANRRAMSAKLRWAIRSRT
jgi:16S rRNA (cytosine1402-N4)-methyltransferase